MSVHTIATRTTFTAARGRETTMRRSGSTERFFLEGDEQEANGYKNLALETDAGVDARGDARRARRHHFDSFDKIPRRKRPLLIVAGFSMILGVALAAWSVDLPTERGLLEGTAVPSALPGPARTPIVAPGTNAAGTNSGDKAIDSAPVRVPAPARSAVAAGMDVSVPTRGYVWSPKTKTLVRVDDFAPAAAETSDPALTAAPGDRVNVDPVSPEFVPAAMEAVPIGSTGLTHEPPLILD